jgi:hypothetical protein
VLVPLAAAASVVVIAVGALVLVPRLVGSTPHQPGIAQHHSGKARHNTPAVPRALAVLPTYTVLNLDGTDLQVLQTATGRIVGTLRHPPNQAFAAMAGTAGDRTFFVATDLNPQTSCQTYFYKLSLKADGRPSALVRLPVAHLPGLPTALAATADGSRVAYSVVGCATGSGKEASSHVIGGIGLIDLAAGRITRRWSYTLGEDYTNDLSISADGSRLGYSNYFNAQYPVGRVLATAAPSGTDQSNSHIVVRQPAATVISASGRLLYAVTGTQPQVLAAYDSNGHRVTALHEWPAAARLGPLVADPAGGYALLPIQRAGKTRTRVVSLSMAGRHTCFAVTVHRQMKCKIMIPPPTRFFSVNLTTGAVTMLPFRVRVLGSIGWGMVAW